MKKHFFRTLAVLMVACLGLGILAACGGNPEDPKGSDDPISGVWTSSEAEQAGTSLTIDVYGEVALTGVKLINVGEYKVLTAKQDTKDVQVIAFREGTANKVFMSISYEIAELKDTKPAPLTDISGVWTNETVTITIEDNKAVMKNEAGEKGAEYCYFELTAADGYYSCGEDIRFTPTATGLTVQLPSTEEGESTLITFTTHTQDLTHVAIDGTYHYVVTDEYGTTQYTIDFTNHTVAEGTGAPAQVSFIQVGGYTIADIEQFLSLPIGNLTGVLVAFKSGNQVYASSFFRNVVLGDKAVELQAAAD